MKDKKYDIVIVSGFMAPPHVGHVRLFKGAKHFGNKVIVALNSDKDQIEKSGSVFRDFAWRREMVEAIRYVDEVISFDGDSEGTALNAIMKVKMLYPEATIAFANGGDRKSGTTPEEGYCNAYKIDMLWGVGGNDKADNSSDIRAGK